MKVAKRVLATYGLIFIAVFSLAGCQSKPTASPADDLLNKLVEEQAAKRAEKERQEAEAAKLAEKERQEAEAAKLVERERQFALQVAKMEKQLPADVLVVNRGGQVRIVVMTHNNTSVLKEQPDHLKLILAGANGFMSGQTTVNKRLAKSLNVVAKSVLEFGNIVIINAHTDNIGAERENQVLSEKRAQAVAKYLFGAGVNKFGQLAVNGSGESEPIADNKTAEGRAKNRRVELILLPPGSSDLTS
jgi:outer membrane protein OmpA-like peptidoglycan-associated protein